MLVVFFSDNAEQAKSQVEGLGAPENSFAGTGKAQRCFILRAAAGAATLSAGFVPQLIHRNDSAILPYKNNFATNRAPLKSGRSFV